MNIMYNPIPHLVFTMNNKNTFMTYDKPIKVKLIAIYEPVFYRNAGSSELNKPLTSLGIKTLYLYTLQIISFTLFSHLLVAFLLLEFLFLFFGIMWTKVTLCTVININGAYSTSTWSDTTRIYRYFFSDFYDYVKYV